MRAVQKTNCIFCKAEMVATEDDHLPLCEECSELKQILDLANGFTKGEFKVNDMNHHEWAGKNEDGSEIGGDSDTEDG